MVSMLVACNCFLFYGCFVVLAYRITAIVLYNNNCFGISFSIAACYTFKLCDDSKACNCFVVLVCHIVTIVLKETFPPQLTILWNYAMILKLVACNCFLFYDCFVILSNHNCFKTNIFAIMYSRLKLLAEIKAWSYNCFVSACYTIVLKLVAFNCFLFYICFVVSTCHITAIVLKPAFPSQLTIV